MKFHLVNLNQLSIFSQLQLEEALLRTDSRNWCLINKGSPPAIVMGISGKKEELVCQDLHQKNPIPIIRRFSGGGTVVVDEATFFVTWIANTKDCQVSCCPKKILDWTATLYQNCFPNINFRLIENDYVIGTKKCGGNAQYLQKERWLHHTSFLWDYRPEHMQLLKIPPKMPTYRQGREHEAFVCKLKEYFVEEAVFFNQLLAGLKGQLELIPTELDMNKVLSILHRQATSYITE